MSIPKYSKKPEDKRFDFNYYEKASFEDKNSKQSLDVPTTWVKYGVDLTAQESRNLAQQSISTVPGTTKDNSKMVSFQPSRSPKGHIPQLRLQNHKKGKSQDFSSQKINSVSKE